LTERGIELFFLDIAGLNSRRRGKEIKGGSSPKEGHVQNDMRLARGTGGISGNAGPAKGEDGVGSRRKSKNQAMFILQPAVLRLRKGRG